MKLFSFSGSVRVLSAAALAVSLIAGSGSATAAENELGWMPMRQVIDHVSNGEQLTIDYVGMARNLNLNPELFRSSWPRGTKRVRR